MLPKFGSNSYTNANNFITSQANSVATYRNTNFFSLVNSLNFAVQYQSNNKKASNSQKSTNNKRNVRHKNSNS